LLGDEFDLAAFQSTRLSDFLHGTRSWRRQHAVLVAKVGNYILDRLAKLAVQDYRIIAVYSCN